MKKIKSLSFVLATALVVSSLATAPMSADAAKKPALSKKKATVYLKKTLKIKVKNGNKKAKVTWKTSNKKVAKITKKSTKGKNAYATIKGLKKGKATITANYKLGKNTKKLTCKVTVKKAPPATASPVPATQAPTQAPVTNAPVVTNAPTTTAPVASNDPTTNPSPTKRPTKSPTPEPTASPTPIAATQPPEEAVKPWPEGAVECAVDLKTVKLSKASMVENADGSITISFEGDGNPEARWDIPETDYDPEHRFLEIVYSGAQGDKGLSVYDKDINWDTPWESGATTKYESADAIKEYAGTCYKIIDLYTDFEDWTEYCTRIDIWAPTTGGVRASDITIHSIKFYKNVAGETPSTEPTVVPSAGPSDTPTEGPTAEPEIVYPTYDLDLSAATLNQGASSYDAASGKYVVNDTASDTVVYFALPETIATGEKVEINVKGTWAGDYGFRFWIGDGPNSLSDAVKVFDKNTASPFDETFVITATGACDFVTLKNIASWAGGGPIGNLEIEKLTVKYLDRGEVIVPTPAPTPEPTPIPFETVEATDYVINGDIDVELSAANQAYTYNASTIEYVDGKANVNFSYQSSGSGVAYYFNADKSPVNLEDYTVVINTTSNASYAMCWSTVNNVTDAQNWWGIGGGDSSATDYWPGVDAGTNDIVFNWSREAQAICIKYNTYGSDTTDNAIFTINSIKLVSKNKVDVKKYEVTSDAEDVIVRLENTSAFGDINLDMAMLQSYADTYGTAYDMIDKMSDRTGGELVKYLGDDASLKYTVADGVATLDYVNGDVTRTSNVTFVEDAGVITATFAGVNNTTTVVVDAAKPNTATVTKNDVTYDITINDEGDDCDVVVTTSNGDYISLAKAASTYTVLATPELIEKYGIVVKYFAEDAE